MTSHLDSSAFHAAHLAAPELPPDRLRLAIDAYLADAGVTLRQIRDGAALSPAEADTAFQPRDVEIDR
jgi:hypothetical protein